MKIKSALPGAVLAGSMLVAGAVLCCAAPANAKVLGLNLGPTIEPTTTPIAVNGYTALDTGVAAATWQFVLGSGGYDVQVGGSATDSKKNDLSLATSTLKLEELEGSKFVTLETLTFVDGSTLGKQWANPLIPGDPTLLLGAGTYDLVFSGGNHWTVGATKFADGPSFSGTVSISGVPEISSWVMMLVGFGALGFAGYRRNKGAAFVG